MTGNEDGIKHVAMNTLYSLQHLGYVIPPQADAGWIGEAGPGPSYADPGSGGVENEFTQRNTTFMTWNLMHVAAMLKRTAASPPTATSAGSGTPAPGSTTRTPSTAEGARPDADRAAQAGVIGLWRSVKWRSLPAASAKRRISSARSSSGSITASTTSSEARWRMSMSSAYSSRLAATNRLALGLVVDRLDLVVEDGVDRRLGPHHGDRRAGQGDAAVGLEGRPGHRVEAGAVGLADDRPRSSAPSPRRRR